MELSLFFSAEGRIPRSQYWVGTLLLIAAQIGVAVLLAQGGDSSAAGLLSIITGIAFTVAGFILAIKRFHDLGKSGWFSLLLLIPLVNFFIWLIWLGCFRGTVGENAYGADPLQVAE